MANNPKNLETDIDALFELPLAEFTPARNALASKLKRDGQAKDAERVKSLSKPSVSAWAVNQLYWKHQKEFTGLMTAGQEFRQAQAAQLSGKSVDARKAGEARQDAISELSRLAAALLRDSGHNPSPEIVRRIATTLEALSAFASVPGGPGPGRLTEDVEAPGFDALDALFSGHIPKRPTPHAEAAKLPHPKAEQPKASENAAAKAALRAAQHALQQAETNAGKFEADLKKAEADLEEAEKRREEAEERIRKVSRNLKEAADAVHKAKREVDIAIKKVVEE